jgi:hypothetical protein
LGRVREIVPMHKEALDNFPESGAFVTHVRPPHRS